jgi:hypothetical protein
MKTKITLSFVFFTLFLECKAQQINYSIVKDDPTFLFHAKAGFFYDADFLKDNNRAAYNYQATVNIGERIAVSGEFIKAYKKWDRPRENAINEFSKSLYGLSGRGTFFFQINDQKEDVRVSLKKTSTNSGNYTITDETFIMAPARTIRKVGVTGSAGFYRNNYIDNQRYDTTFQIQDQSGNSVNSMNFATSFSGIRFSGGFHATITQNFVINAQNASTGERYGRKSVRNKTDVFAEVLYMPTVGVETSLVGKPDNGGGNYTIANKPDIKNLGMRLLVESYTTGPLGIGLRLEFGARPGITYNIHSSGKLKNMYMAAGFFLVFNK